MTVHVCSYEWLENEGCEDCDNRLVCKGCGKVTTVQELWWDTSTYCDFIVQLVADVMTQELGSKKAAQRFIKSEVDKRLLANGGGVSPQSLIDFANDINLRLLQKNHTN